MKASLVFSAVLLCISLGFIAQTQGQANYKSEHKTWKEAAKWDGATEAEIHILAKQKFVTASQTYREVFEPYINGNLSVFVTSVPQHHLTIQDPHQGPLPTTAC